MFPSTDVATCASLPSSGYRGRSFRKPCGSPPSQVLWSCKTARPSARVPSGRPLGSRTSRDKRRSSWCGRGWGALLGSWAVPLKACPGLETPATPARPRYNGRCRMLPSARLRASAFATFNDFGAEFSRPAFLLCTLRTHRLPSEWQHSLLVCLLDFNQAGLSPAGLQ